MHSNHTRIYKFNRPGGMPPESFSKLLWIGGTILFLFFLSLALRSTGSILLTVFRYLILIPIILISLSFHEYCHARMADFLGDPTPRRMGRLSLNPLRHLDPLGALMLFFTNFGWAKPVMVDARNFRIPKRAMVSVAMAGPLSNFSLALLGGGMMKLFSMAMPLIFSSELLFLLTYKAIEIFIIINLSLAFFNLLPLPPLDGSRLVSYFMPNKYRVQYRNFEEMAPFILLILFVVGGLGPILSPMIYSGYNFILSVFGHPDQIIKLELLKLMQAGSTF